MWLTLIITLLVVGAMTAFRFNVFGMLFLSLIGFAATSASAWLLSYSLGSSLIVGIGSLAAVQVGFFGGLLMQLWLAARSADADQRHFPTGKADILTRFF